MKKETRREVREGKGGERIGRGRRRVWKIDSREQPNCRIPKRTSKHCKGTKRRRDKF
jgi:hypothetical protein